MSNEWAVYACEGSSLPSDKETVYAYAYVEWVLAFSWIDTDEK